MSAESKATPVVGGVGRRTPPSKDFANTHRVKKLLETYTMTAERSLMGPDHSDYYDRFKLPPDVELSKTSLNEPQRVDVEASKRLQMQMAAVQASMQAGLKGGGPPSPNPMSGTNGLVTLSRIDGNGFDEYGRHKSRSSSHDPRHLTGEMIRQMNALQKKGGNASAAAAAAASLAYQHQLQMQATYERVLKEKTYLKYNKAVQESATSSSALPAAAAAAKTLVAPVFSARDRGHPNLSETRLANRDIACFEVGGEKRCCLPQILNSVLDQISLAAIHAACDELQIYCSTCTHEQLDVLKVAKIIPDTAAQCGLITKSDAERLCSKLLDCSPPVASMMGFNATASPFSFRVQHECFGKCRGIVLPEAYTSANARCIECLECEGLFCPAKFVCHSHRNRENRTCHWGFDSSNWRAYLHLADDYTVAEKDKLSKTVADFKARYANSVASSAAATVANQYKRKLDSASHNGGRERSLEAKSPRHPEPPKKAKIEHPDYPGSGNDPYGLLLYQTWAAAAAGKAAGAGPHLHPAAAAAAAWSSHYAQAIKDGKTSRAVVPASRFSPGMPPPRPSSSTGHNGGSFHRGYEKMMVDHHPHHPSGLVKSSPLSDSAESPPERLTHSIESPGEFSSHRKKPSSSSLAEDILAIRAALEGASTSARERILKILERLTARLALAESERDMAIDQMKKLHRRYELTEEELHKKRAELREALRNDVATSSIHLRQQPPPSSRSSDIIDVGSKVELKSPARVIIEEKSCGDSSRSSRSTTPPVSASAMMVASKAVLSSVDNDSPNTIDSSLKLTHLRRRSGTPASIRSRESEDIRERMMTMEAEIRALRDELSNRSSLSSNATKEASNSAATKVPSENETDKAASKDLGGDKRNDAVSNNNDDDDYDDADDDDKATTT